MCGRCICTCRMFYRVRPLTLGISLVPRYRFPCTNTLQREFVFFFFFQFISRYVHAFLNFRPQNENNAPSIEPSVCAHFHLMRIKREIIDPRSRTDAGGGHGFRVGVRVCEFFFLLLFESNLLRQLPQRKAKKREKQILLVYINLLPLCINLLPFLLYLLRRISCDTAKYTRANLWRSFPHRISALTRLCHTMHNYLIGTWWMTNFSFEISSSRTCLILFFICETGTWKNKKIWWNEGLFFRTIFFIFLFVPFTSFLFHSLRPWCVPLAQQFGPWNSHTLSSLLESFDASMCK